ncbi:MULTISPECIES: BlaI/MecI/CopY family transcriptional regulator [Roseateles]|uniref:Transcriptional regulator n=1 Tax=Pelomonas aquatica TaxID=431058 RepID=A0ABU1ZCK6_9BURK|nr:MULTISPECIES: BlaI/MecI/CopY family transcriptional regulator [Roseateles]KQY88829.1 BlaI/MecI/CopY family transcriptional regulator [Pelomonas sp. Root1444]MDR7297766.1 putative transcriptional regulator [Pelomonas aquatica]
MEKPTSPISEAEALVMQELWARSPQGADEIATTVGSRQGWQLATVKTLLNRLLKKGAVTAERDGRRFLYAPAVPQDAWVADTGLSLIDRLFGGRLAPLVAQFASERKLKPEDVEALKALLKEQGHE